MSLTVDNVAHGAMTAGAVINTARNLYNTGIEGASLARDVYDAGSSAMQGIKRSLGGDEEQEGQKRAKNSEISNSGGMGSTATGGMNYSIARPFNTGSTRFERVYKRHILSTNVLLGTDGKKDLTNNTYASAVTLPTNMWEFWFANNLGTGVQTYANAIFQNINSQFRIKSLTLTLSKLQIFEDILYIAAGVETTQSSNNNNVYAILQTNDADNNTPCYSNPTTANSVQASVDDTSVIKPTVSDLARGNIVCKSDNNELNVLSNCAFWNPGDPPISYNVQCNKSIWFQVPGIANTVVHMLPMSGLVAFPGAVGNQTYTSDTNNAFAAFSALDTKNIVDGVLRIAVPRIANADGTEKKFRISMFIEQEAVVEFRNQWLQNIVADKYNLNVGASLVKINIIGDGITAEHLEPPHTRSGLGFTPYDIS